MSDDLERLSRVLDDLAAERDPRDRADLSAAEADLAETAAMLKAAHVERALPREEFVARLGERLAAARAEEKQAEPRTETASAVAASGVSRRGLLGRLAGAAAGLAVGAGTGAAAAYNQGYTHGRHDGYADQVKKPFSQPLVEKDRGEWIDTGLTAHSVAPGQAVRFRAGAIEGFLVNPGNGAPLYALSAACTHMGCMVSWLDSAETFLCPCHGAQYRSDGSVLNGIARQPLPKIDVKRDSWGHLLVYAVAPHPRVTTLAPYSQP